MLNFKYKKIGSWLAIFAMLLISFAPLVSQAFPVNSSSNQYDVICSSTGIKLINTDHSSSDENPAVHPLVHCNFCLLSVDKVIIQRVIQKNNVNYEKLTFTTIEYYSPFVINYFLVTQLPNAPPSI